MENAFMASSLLLSEACKFQWSRVLFAEPISYVEQQRQEERLDQDSDSQSQNWQNHQPLEGQSQVSERLA